MIRLVTQAIRRSLFPVLLLSLVLQTHAQSGSSGTILGTVTDNTGAVIVGANIDVIDLATNTALHTSSNGSGEYTVPFLKPGSYRVVVNSSGFQQSVAEHVVLAVAQTVRLDMKLQPGMSTQVVEVNSSAVAMDTDSSAISQIISNKQVTELPLNGRNFLQLLFVGAGAVTIGGEQASMRGGQGAAISINGSRPESNNYILDGMPNTDEALNTPAVVLSVEAIQEFKEQTATYSAQYGFSANQVNLSSRSGTNNLHGALFWFGRNDALDAQNYFHQQGTPTPILRQNQFGFVVNGPVYLPKIYHGRDKTFWLANYEGWRIKQGVTTFQNVPDPTQLAGNFNSLAGEAPCVPGSATKGCLPIDPATGAPFPGNQIPSSRFSRVTQVALANSSFPAPNCSAASCNGYNHTQTPTLPLNTDQQTYRIDQNMGRWGSIFGRGTYAKYTNTTLSNSISVPIGYTTFNEESTNWVVSHTINFGPHLVNNFLFGRLNATANQGGYPALTNDVSTLALKGVFTQLSNGQRTYPSIQFGNNLGENLTTYGGAINSYTTSNQPMWNFSDNLTIIAGSHTIAIGADYRRWVFHRNLASNPLGSYTYSDYFSGNQIADLLLGYYSAASTFQPSGLSSPNGNPRQFRFQYFAPFLQDDWKATQNLTLNLGLRWDWRPFPYEEQNHMGWLDVTNPNGGLCIADQTLVKNGITNAAPGFGTFYRYCGKRTPKDTEKSNFGPRFGFAYRATNKMVVRGGYGIFWDSVEGREIDGSADIYPYVIRTSLTQTPGALLPGLETTDKLFVDYSSSVGPVVPGPTGQDSFLAVNISERPFNPYVQQYSLSVQREIAANTTLEVNYIGNKGTHLLGRQNINQPLAPSDFCKANPTATECPANQRYPYPYFGNFFINSMWGAYSNYNSGTVKMERRAKDMAITAAYTYAKSMDIKSAAAAVGASSSGWQGFMDNHNPNRDYGPSDFSVNHRFVTSFVYDLPFGRGKTLAGHIGRLADLGVGGWQLNGIYTAQTGFPFSVTANDVSGLLGTSAQRANLVGNARSGFNKGRQQWLNTTAFAQPAIGTYGSSSRNYLTLPGINNWDIGFFKNTSITESVHFQLRLESFNTFNHPQFHPDPSTAAFAGGGSTVDNNVNDANFGKITAAAPGRIVQLGAKILF